MVRISQGEFVECRSAHTPTPAQISSLLATLLGERGKWLIVPGQTFLSCSGDLGSFHQGHARGDGRRNVYSKSPLSRIRRERVTTQPRGRYKRGGDAVIEGGGGIVKVRVCEDYLILEFRSRRHRGRGS